jgi:multiple sugar transport system permease protein
LSSPAGSLAYTQRWWRYARYATVLTVLVLVLLPFVWLLVTSLKPNRIIFAIPPVLVFKPTLQNYVDLWDGIFPPSFLNSTVIAVSTTVLSILIGVPGAYALSRARFRHKEQLSLWILASRMAPPIAFTIPYFLAYRHAGLQDTLAGLVIIYLTFNLSLVVWMMRSFFDALPVALEEAAWIDGASMFQAFFRIVLPLSAPGLAATAILCFIYAWNDFFFALILTRTNATTATVAIVNFMNLEGWEWGKIAAGGTLVMLPVIVFSFLVRRYLVAGLAAGAVKG